MDSLYIEKVLSGDSHAFRYFIQNYKDMAFSVALSVVKQEHLAEEVAQESFVQCYLSLSAFKKQSKFSTWFYRIIVNCAYKSLRKKPLDVVEFELESHDVEFEENALSKLMAEEQKQLVNEALLRIPANESLALRLFYLEEVSLSELSEIAGWTNANAKVILFRGRKRLYTELNKLMKGTYYGV